MMAARSLISLYRILHPELLHKKDRGRPTEAAVEAGAALRYGELDAKDFIPGAEVVNSEGAPEETNNKKVDSRKRKAAKDLGRCYSQQ